MKVLILGSTGMLGHKLMQVLARRFCVVGTLRGSAATYAGHPALGGLSLIGDVQIEDFDSVVGALAAVGVRTLLEKPRATDDKTDA